MVNPYDPPSESRDSDETRDSSELGFFQQMAINAILTVSTWVFYVVLGLFVALLYWLGGQGLVYGVLIGLPVLAIVVVVLLFWFFAESQEERHEYLREKRRRMREQKSKVAALESEQSVVEQPEVSDGEN